MSFDTEHLHDIRISAQVGYMLVKLWFQEGYFTPFEPSQLVGKTKTGDPWEKHQQPNPQAELS